MKKAEGSEHMKMGAETLHKSLKFILVLAAFPCCMHHGNCQNTIPAGKSTTIDGIIADGEWDDAALFAFDPNEFLDIKVFIKHDKRNLLILYRYNNQQDGMYYIPEFFIDTEPDKSRRWEKDDYWFHVSAQDCYSAGKRDDFSQCSMEDRIWTAEPNIPFGRSTFRKIEDVEISVPFELMNVVPGQTIGICFSVVFSEDEIRVNYPGDSDEDVPASWLELAIE